MQKTQHLTRREARAAGDLHYRTGKPCRNGHSTVRRASDGKCVECVREKKAAQRRRKGITVRRINQRRRRQRARWKRAAFQVYVIAAGDFVKIGLAGDVKARVAVIQSSCPHPVEVKHVTEAMDRHRARRIEAGAHGVLHASRVHGEWFQASVPEALGAVRFAETLP